MFTRPRMMVAAVVLAVAALVAVPSLVAGQLDPRGGRQDQHRNAAAATGPTFMLGTFNTLGSIHTNPGGRHDHYAPWRIRTDWAARHLESKDLSVAGLQELEKEQIHALTRATGGRYAMFPGASATGRNAMTSLLWRKDTWTAQRTETLTIPFMKWQQQIPVVQLQHRATGRRIWVINAHNAPGVLQAQRDEALRIEIARIKQLQESGLPVFFLGDMNERDVFCKVRSQTTLITPAGGTWSPGGCTLPPRARIDWIFGPPQVGYADYRLERPALIGLTTDHHVASVRVTLP